jgi:uncharacterized protein GlcG (DUF336 family)
MLTLEQANTAATVALRVGRDRGFQPLTVVVLDAGGHMVAVQREDGSGILRVEMAAGKAYGALGLGISSRKVGNTVVERPQLGPALAAASGGRVVPVPGGVLMRDDAGAIVGAVGITGDVSDHDELCAIEGVKAAGLKPDPAEPAVA